MTEYLNERISAYVEHRVPRNAELDVDDELIGLLTDCINEQATRYMQSEFWPFKVPLRTTPDQESSSQESQEPSSQESAASSVDSAPTSPTNYIPIRFSYEDTKYMLNRDTQVLYDLRRQRVGRAKVVISSLMPGDVADRNDFEFD